MFNDRRDGVLDDPIREGAGARERRVVARSAMVEVGPQLLLDILAVVLGEAIVSYELAGLAANEVYDIRVTDPTAGIGTDFFLLGPRRGSWRVPLGSGDRGDASRGRCEFAGLATPTTTSAPRPVRCPVVEFGLKLRPLSRLASGTEVRA